MKPLHHSATMFFLCIILTSCTSMSTPTEFPQLASTRVTTQTIQSAQVVIPADVAFSAPLVQALSQSGLSIMSVRSSTYMAFFQSTDKVVWIETDEGIVEAVFFANSAEVEQIHITEQTKEGEPRYLYTIHAPAPTLVHDQTIDAAFPLYFTPKNDILMITSSEELDKTLKHILSAQ